jgi:hypothetical protein
MEPTNTTDGPTLAPFAAASKFGAGLPLQALPGWWIEFAYDGQRTHLAWTDGEHVVMQQAAEA